MLSQYHEVHGSLKLGQEEVKNTEAARNHNGTNMLKNRPTSTNVLRSARRQERYYSEIRLYVAFQYPHRPPTTRGGDHYSRQREFVSLPCNEKGLKQIITQQKPTNPRKV